MSEKRSFQGKILRVERDGFGIVQFDKALGANTHGVFSTDISERTVPFRQLRAGMHVSGVAEVDDRDLAAVKTIEIEPGQ
jgi:hypothetical protein